MSGAEKKVKKKLNSHFGGGQGASKHAQHDPTENGCFQPWRFQHTKKSFHEVNCCQKINRGMQ